MSDQLGKKKKTQHRTRITGTSREVQQELKMFPNSETGMIFPLWHKERNTWREEFQQDGASALQNLELTNREENI